MTNKERAKSLTEEAVWLLRNKPVNSTYTERTFLLDEARREVARYSQPLRQGKGLAYVLERASLPIDERDFLLGRFIDKVPTDEEEALFREIWRERSPNSNQIINLNGGHLTLDWETIVKDGITGYISRAEKRLLSAEAGDEAVYVEGMIEVYRSVRNYIARYAVAADEAGKADCAEICRNLTLRAPETFREALQLVLFVFIIYSVYAGNAVGCMTLGRMDMYLLPYYERDISSGALTKDDAECLIDDFYSKTNLILGRGEHQMANSAFGGNTTGWERNPAFDSPAYILLGGYTSTEKEAPSNPLTELMVDRIEPRCKHPVIVYRHTNKDPDSVLRILYDKIRNNASVLIYNDETMIPAMENAGVLSEDAVRYSIHACNWPDVHNGAIVGSFGGPIPRLIVDVLDKKRDFSSVDDIYAALAEHFRRIVREHFDRYRRRYRSGKLPPSELLSFTDCFYFGVLDSARASTGGGVKYPALYALVRNIGTAADMMSAISELVYKRGECTLEELCDAADNNFEGFEKLLAKCRRMPKFGTDDDVADGHAVRLLNTLLNVIDEESVNENGVRDVVSLNVAITDMNHIGEGRALKATCDGRLAGTPLSENLSPSVGYSDSVTALLNSVSKLPFERMHSGACNVRLRRDAVDGDDGLERLMILCETYFENGGMQLQLSIADTSDLYAAQKNPDEYRDLMVRVTGYSAIFVDMSKNAQDEIIRRDELA